MRRTAPYFRFALALLMTGGSWQCGGPTGKDDEPQLKVEPLVLDFGTERTSLSLTIGNTGNGILNFHIQISFRGLDYRESDRRDRGQHPAVSGRSH